MQYIDECVDCPREIGCMGDACPYKNVPVVYCDQCGYEKAEYHIDGEDFCEECAEEYLQCQYDGLTVMEKADLLDVTIYKYN